MFTNLDSSYRLEAKHCNELSFVTPAWHSSIMTCESTARSSSAGFQLDLMTTGLLGDFYFSCIVVLVGGWPTPSKIWVRQIGSSSQLLCSKPPTTCILQMTDHFQLCFFFSENWHTLQLSLLWKMLNLYYDFMRLNAVGWWKFAVIARFVNKIMCNNPVTLVSRSGEPRMNGQVCERVNSYK